MGRAKLAQMLVGDMMKAGPTVLGCSLQGQSPEEEAVEKPTASRPQAVPKAKSKVEESSSDDAMVELSAGVEDKDLGFDVAQRDSRQPRLVARMI